METQMKHDVQIVRQALHQQRPVDEQVLTTAAILSDRLDMLKQSSPLFEAVSLSPQLEAMMAEQLTAVAN